MRGENNMKSNKYSVEIANAVKEFLVNDDWHFSFDEKSGVFKFGLCIDSKIKKIDYQIRVHNDDYTVYAFSPVGADTDDRDMMLKMAEFVCRANYGLRRGNFELDMRDGEIRYKTYVDCHGGMTPSNTVVKGSIYCCASMFDTYAPGILDIIFGDSTAKTAVEKCEKSPEDELRELLGEEASGEGDLHSMLDRLAERFGITADELAELEDAAEDVGGTGDSIRMDLFPGEGGAA